MKTNRQILRKYFDFAQHKHSAILALIVVLAAALPLVACAKEPAENGMITMTTKSSKVSLIVEGSKDISIDWGDGKKSNVNDAILDGISEWLYFNYDYLSSTVHNIVITGNVTLLYCGANQLTDLDVSRNPTLTDLNCGRNQLTALDVSKNIALERLESNQNQLTALDVSKNRALRNLSIVGNQFTAAALNDLFRMLPDRSNLEPEEVGGIYIQTYSGGGNPGNNNCDRSIAEVRGWIFHAIRELIK